MKSSRRNQEQRSFDPAEGIVRILNTSPENEFDRDIRTELRKLVAMWHASGPNTGKMMRDNPDCLPTKAFGYFIPTGTGHFHFSLLFTKGEESRYTPKELAQWNFLQFAADKDWEKSQPWGPCACGCKHYFLKKSKHRKIFCHGHGSAVSASKAMKQKQAEKRAPRIRAAKKAIRRYENLHKRGDWKVFVDSEAQISPRTLSRWVAKGFIQPPKGRK